MPSNKEYTTMTLEELALQEKKLKSQRTMMAVLIGVFFGLAVWAATHNTGFLITVILLVFPLYLGNKQSQNLKSIQAEINGRATAG